MTSFQRMVLVAAALFMITAHVTAHVTDAMYCNCRIDKDCKGYRLLIEPQRVS